MTRMPFPPQTAPKTNQPALPGVGRMPSLNVAASGTTAPTIPTPDDSEVTVWSDSRGVIGALSHTTAQEHWLHVLGIASFKLELEVDTVTAIPHQGSKPEAIVDEFQRTVWPTMLQLRGHEVLHGSAVHTPGGVVAFCALSETGKSTLAYALNRRGYALFADDAVVLTVTPDSVEAHALPFQVRLRSASALHFGYAQAQLVAGRVRCKGQQENGPLPLAAVCLLEQLSSLPDGRIVTTEALAPTEALVSALEHALYFSLQDRQRKRHMMQQYFSLASRIPMFRVRFQRGLELLPNILDALEQDILQRPARIPL